MAVARVRGAARVLSAMLDQFERDSPDDEALRVAIAHAQAPEQAAALASAVRTLRPLAAIELLVPLGPVIGTYGGPGHDRTPVGRRAHDRCTGSRRLMRGVLSWLRALLRAIAARRGLMIGLQAVFLVALALFFSLELRSTWRGALPLLRHASIPDLFAAAAVRRRLLPRVRVRLAGDPAAVRDAAALPRGAAGRDAEPAREVHSGRRLDARGPGRRRAPLRHHRHHARADIDRARGGPLGDLRHRSSCWSGSCSSAP